MADYEVFVQSRPETPHEHVGSVRAPSPALALQAAKEIYTRRDRPAGLWVVDRAHIVALDPADNDLFAIAQAKEYRQPAYFVRRLRERRVAASDPGEG